MSNPPPPRIYRPGKSDADAEMPPAEPPDDGAMKPAVQPFPLDCLPTAAATMARGICEVERVPESLAGCCVLGILSASVGAGVVVKSGPQRYTRANLYILPSADSGSGKSETFRHAARPFQDFERQQLEHWRAKSLPGLQAEKDVLEGEIARLKKEIATPKKGYGPVERAETLCELESKKAELLKVESELQPPVLSVEDITTEKLAALLARRGECLASLSADAGGIVNNLLGRYNKLDRTDEGIYLKAFSGDSHRVDRIGREPVLLNNPCLSALWLVQPDKLETLLGERSLTDGGLIPRFLACHTDSQPQQIIDGVQPIPESVISAYGELVCGMVRNYRIAKRPIIVTPAPEALKAMNDHHNRIVERRRKDLHDVRTFAARWTEQAWRIAVVFHGALWPGGDGNEHELALETAERAIALADWFADQQLGILSSSRDAARRVLQDQVLELMADHPDGITARDAHRARLAKTSEEARQLLQRLEAEGILAGKDTKPKGGGHPTRVYQKARK